jgi:hypothetical protein
MKGTTMRSLPYLAVTAVILVCAAMFIVSTEKTSAQVANESTLIPPIDTMCTVTLRSDVVPTIYGQNNNGNVTPPFASQTLTGTLTAISDQWVVIGTNTQTYWIPRNLVVMIQFAK